MSSVTVSAPGKLMLFGEHAVVYGKPCIVTAVDQRLRVTAGVIDTPEFIIDAPDVGLIHYRKPMSEIGKGIVPKAARFVEQGVKNFIQSYSVIPAKAGIQGDGSPIRSGMTFDGSIKVTSHSDFASTFGFGSSSAVTVCTIYALAELYEVNITKEQLFDLSYKTVLDVQGAGSGFDIAAAIWGGTLYYTSPRHPVLDTGSHPRKNEIADQVRNDKLEIIVGYTGIKADTTTLIKQVKEYKEKNPAVFSSILQSMKLCVEQAKIAIENNDERAIGTLMNENQALLEKLEVSSPELDRLITAARNAGAYGAKLSGAGGGDCMIAITSDDKKNDVEKAISDAGGEIMKVNSNAKGIRIETRS